MPEHILDDGLGDDVRYGHPVAVPARRPVDDALDRLRQQINKSRATYVPGTPEKYPATELRGLTVLEAEALLAQAEQLREERDAYAERVRQLREERDNLYENNWPWEWVIATREKERRQAAEAERDEWEATAEEVGRELRSSNEERRRLTEGLRKIENASISQGYERYEDDVVGAWVVDEARALLSASPSGGGGA